MGKQAGFTLIELVIALFLAALISLIMVVALRQGMAFLERSRSFYGELQETLAVSSYMRRVLAGTNANQLSGEDNELLLQAGVGFRCRENGNNWVLEREQLTNSKDGNNDTPSDTLLDHLSACRFDYLEGPAKAANKSGLDADTPAPFQWLAKSDTTGTLVAVRLTLSSRHLDLAPVVFPLAKAKS